MPSEPQPSLIAFRCRLWLRFQAQVRIGDTVHLDFKVKEPTVYPVDLYYLMDLSNSMEDDLKNVNKLAIEIGEYS